MEKEIDNLEFVQRVNIEFVDSLKNNGTKYLLIFYNPSEETCNSKAFVDIASVKDIADWVLFTLSTTGFIKASLGETLRSRTRTLFFSSLLVTWYKSIHLVDSWYSDQSQWTGIKTQHLLPTVIYWLICRHAQTID